MTLDKFGILQLNPTISGGKEYFSTSFNSSRTYSNTSRKDGVDPNLFYRLSNATAVIGNGKIVLTGPTPRIFVNGPWTNTELTAAVRVQSRGSVKYSHIGSRSNHEVFDSNHNRCGFGRYYVKYNHYVKAIAAGKEVMHPFHIANEQGRSSWSQGISTNWTYLKTVVRTDAINNRVFVEGYVNHSDPKVSRSWIKKTSWYDDGSQDISIKPEDRHYIQKCIGPPLTSDPDTILMKTGKVSEENLKQIWLKASKQCYIRTEEAKKVEYKQISVREIAPIS